MMFLRMLPIAIIICAMLFIPAGRLDVPAFWAYVGVMLLSAGATTTALGRMYPDLLAERMRPPSDRDRATRRLVALPFGAHLVVAGLDVRFGWSAVPAVLQAMGIVSVVGGFALVAWTLLTNPFASSAVRIQTEREHKVISTGPYALVRHPMYLAVLFVCSGGGLALGSWWSALALSPVIGIFVRRTLLEDRMLHEELAGYREYAAKVRWRVVPGLF